MPNKHKTNFANSYSFFDKDYWSRKLDSFDIDLLDPKKKINNKTQIELFKKNVEVIVFELSSYCNRQCSYCPLTEYKRNEELYMPDKIFQSIISDLKKISYNKSIHLNGYNEPFYDFKKFTDYLKYIKTNLPRAILVTNSNGDYLDKNKLIKIAEENLLQKIKITIHPPKKKQWDFDYSFDKIKNFLKKINVTFVEKDLLSESNKNEIYHFFKIKNLSVLVQSVNFDLEGTNRSGILKKHSNVYKRVKPCEKPFREFTIYYDGSVTQCCDAFYDQKYKTNKISALTLNNNIFKIYNSFLMRRIRRELFDWEEKKNICSNCSAAGYAKISDEKKRNEILKNLF